MTEIWLPIFGHENSHKVSNLGNVKSLDREVKGKLNSTRKLKGKNLSLKTTINGYKSVQLAHKGQSFLVHRLVAKAFIPQLEGKEFVNHINGDKSDNRSGNLEWVSQSENQFHAYKTGLQVGKSLKGDEGNTARPIDVFDLQGNKIHSFGSTKTCAETLNLRPNSIRRVLYGERTKYHNMVFRFQ